MTIAKQKPKTDWMDESGKTVPFSAIKKSEKVYEVETFVCAKEAIKVKNSLKRLRGIISASIAKCIEVFQAEYNGKKKVFKGNYTIKNFNDTIKVEVKVSNPIKFDDLTIQLAKDKLREFLKRGVHGKAEIKEMVMDAFETSRGRLDVQKILSLKRYSDRIDDHRWKEAMKLIDQAIRRPATATYYQVWVKNEMGKYEAIQLALSDV